MHPTHKHTHTHKDMTSDLSGSSIMCTLTYGWLEGKSSCRLSVNSNKRTIENNKTGSHSGSWRKKKKFPFVSHGNFSVPCHSNTRASQECQTGFHKGSLHFEGKTTGRRYQDTNIWLPSLQTFLMPRITTITHVSDYDVLKQIWFSFKRLCRWFLHQSNYPVVILGFYIAL